VRRPRPLQLLATIALVALLSLSAAGSASARARARTAKADPVPSSFVGVDIDGPMVDDAAGIDLTHQFNTMVSVGVGNIRMAFNWAGAQPYQSWAEVPAGQQGNFTDVGGIPTDFAATDQMVGLAAQRGMSVLPTVLYAPSWDARDNPVGVDTPAQPGPYAAYVTALVHRYGPHGSFWSANPQIPARPIRMWQIWNEENLSYYWQQPFASSYIPLLRAAHNAIKSADPGAKVIVGALTNMAWNALGQLYHRGARKLFDAVAVNGFTKKPANVILYLRLVRRAMDRFKDRHKPLYATEVSWPSAVGDTKVHFDWDTTEAGQARNIAALLPMLGADRFSLGLKGFYYYNWMGVEDFGALDFSFAGLVGITTDGQVFTKPALGAFKRGALALEHCKVKSSVATRCAKR
jgi:hypothetical protein